MKKLRGRKKNRKAIVACLAGVMFLFAISPTMTGSLMPDILEQYMLSNMQVGFIGAVQSIGSIVAMFLGTLFADRFPKLKTIVLFFTLYAFVLTSIGRAPVYPTLLILFLLLGMTSSYLNLLLSAFVSEEYGERRTTCLNLLHGLFSLGSLAGPVYAGILGGWGHTWNHSFTGIGIICAGMLLFLLVFALPFETVDRGGRGKRIFPWKLLRDRQFLLLTLFGTFFMCYQGGVGSWIAVYLQKGLECSPACGSLALTLFWTGIMCGRFLQPLIGRWMNYEKWLSFSCAVSVPLYTTAFLMADPRIIISALLIVGILLGAAYPLILAVACGMYTEISGTVTSLMSLIQSAAGIVSAAAIGWIMDRAGYRRGILFIPVLLLCSVVFFFLFENCRKVEGQQENG